METFCEKSLIVLFNIWTFHQLPHVRHLNLEDEVQSRFLALHLPVDSSYPYQCLWYQPWQQEDPLMKTLLRMMKTGEVSRSLRIGKSLLLKGMNNLGILWRKRVKISSMEQSTWSLFRFGTLLYIVNLEFCQLSLLALKMSIVWKKLVSK